MNEREIEMALRATDFSLTVTQDADLCSNHECEFCLCASDRRALFGARDALTIELNNIRAGRPWGSP